ncbi:MAG: hypothetical protein ACRD1H_01790, partial [Vicinamibacterales bacterium]
MRLVNDTDTPDDLVTTDARITGTAAAVAQTRVDYANAVAADYQAFVATTAASARNHANQAAAAIANREITIANADSAYLNGIGAVERNYRINVANIERQYRINMAEAKRDSDTQWSAQQAAQQQRDLQLDIARMMHAVSEQQLAAIRAGRIGSAQLSTAQLMANAIMGQITSTSTAVQTFADAQEGHDLDRIVTIADLERNFALLTA